MPIPSLARRSLATIVGFLPAGCESMRLASGPPLPIPLDPARDLASMRNPSTDVLSVAAWALALVVAALVIAFVARLLNGRSKSIVRAPLAKEP